MKEKIKNVKQKLKDKFFIQYPKTNLSLAEIIIALIMAIVVIIWVYLSI